MNRHQREVGSYLENSIVGDSEDTIKGKYCPCEKKEKRDLGPMVTCCDLAAPKARTINQAEHPA